VSSTLAPSSALEVPIRRSLEWSLGWAIISQVNISVVSEWPYTSVSEISGQCTDSYERYCFMRCGLQWRHRKQYLSDARQASLHHRTCVASQFHLSLIHIKFLCRWLRAHVYRNWLDLLAYCSRDLQAHQQSPGRGCSGCARRRRE
jgi:hypothetical protein